MVKFKIGGRDRVRTCGEVLSYSGTCSLTSICMIEVTNTDFCISFTAVLKAREVFYRASIARRITGALIDVIIVMITIAANTSSETILPPKTLHW